MRIAVAATAEQKVELLNQGLAAETQVLWIDDFNNVQEADAIIDLLFDTDEEKRLEIITALPQKVIIVNYVNGDIKNQPAHSIRLNGWPTFLSRSIAEVYSDSEELKPTVEKIFAAFNKQTVWTTGTPGFITARAVSMIINEAYMALEENVSTKIQIDIAMKTGTNYPYGPFEWCDKIGIKKIYGLLKKLEEINDGYKPSNLLTKEAAN